MSATERVLGRAADPKPVHTQEAYKEAAKRILPTDKDDTGLNRYTIPAHANVHPIVGARGAYVEALIWLSDDEVVGCRE